MGFLESVAKFFQPEKRPDKQNVNQNRLPYALSAYDLASVELAVLDHEQGNFQWSSGLFDAIDRDDRVNSCFNTRELAVTGLPFDFEPAENPGDTQRAYAAIKRNWPLLFSPEAQRQVIRTTGIMGFCVATINGYREGQPYLEPWHPRWISYNSLTGAFEAESEWEEKKGIRRSGKLTVKPGDGTWVLFKNRFSRPWMGGLIRVLPQLVVYRQSNMIDWGRLGKRLGNAPIVIESTDVKSAKIPDYQRLADALQELVGDSVITLPNGAKASLLEIKNNASQVFSSFGPDFLDQCIAISILGQNLTTSSSGAGGLGSNVSTTQSKVRQDYIESDVSVLNISHRQVCWPYYMYQHGISEFSKVARPVWDIRPPEDAKLNAEVASTTANAWNTGMDAIAKAKAAGYQIDEVEAMKILRMPMKKAQ